MHATVLRAKPLVVHLAIPLLTGFAAAYLSGNNRSLYESLRLPGWAPPAALFSVAWTVLYLLIGFAAYLVYTADNIRRQDRRGAMGIYGLSLLANFLWSFLFFRFRLFAMAAWWIVIIFLTMALCTALFYHIRPWAGWLMGPVLIWLLYAGALNFSVALLN